MRPTRDGLVQVPRKGVALALQTVALDCAIGNTLRIHNYVDGMFSNPEGGAITTQTVWDGTFKFILSQTTTGAQNSNTKSLSGFRFCNAYLTFSSGHWHLTLYSNGRTIWTGTGPTGSASLPLTAVGLYTEDYGPQSISGTSGSSGVVTLQVRNNSGATFDKSRLVFRAFDGGTIAGSGTQPPGTLGTAMSHNGGSVATWHFELDGVTIYTSTGNDSFFGTFVVGTVPQSLSIERASGDMGVAGSLGCP